MCALCSSVLGDNKSTFVAHGPLSKDAGFISECPSDHYGRNCSSRCGHCYGKAACDIVTGKCEHGCEPGYMGDKCLQSKKHIRPMIRAAKWKCLNIKTIISKIENCLRQRKGTLAILVSYPALVESSSSKQWVLFLHSKGFSSRDFYLFIYCRSCFWEIIEFVRY